MKKNILKKILLIVMVATTTITSAQRPGGKGLRQQEKKEDIESIKIAFLTQKLELTPEEAQKFWPVYNQYTDRLKELRKKRRQDSRDAKQNLDELSDKEIEQSIDNDLGMKQKELDLQKEYNVKFKSVLPIKKVAQLYKAEEQFKLELIRKLKDRAAAKE